MAGVSPRANANQFITPPMSWGDEEEHRRKLAEILDGVMDGKINSTGSVTLTASATTTTLLDRRIGTGSVLLFMPTTENAAGEIGMYVSARGDGTATITHASMSQTDRTFAYAVLG